MSTNTDSPVLDGVWFRPVLINPNNANSGSNSIPPTAKSVQVGAVVNDANDWITLPSLADVANGHEIIILALAGGNFELRTPTSSNEKINNVDSDATQEYLVTDTHILRAIKVSNTVGWVIQSLTVLGAVVTAVVPD